jgi:hypothetical protein
MTFLKKILNAMIRNIKIYNIYDIIENLESMEPNKCTHQKKKNENIYLSVSHDFSKFNGSKKIKV